ncbi:FAD/NAD(P)-binding domain-containing protein [Xylariaceae sp. FL1019]|nr:FAD/NAD(P)-binding domain-containing protein [Xylariaceae sp. FL1019]
MRSVSRLLSCLSASQRETSRIWKDLKAYHHMTTIQLGVEDMSDTIVRRKGKRRSHIHDRKPHVGIVGAGLAGLRCADVLLDHGFKITLLEGRGRLGGRVHQVALPSGRLVDAGPNWIHGTNDNPIIDLAKQTQTGTGSVGADENVFDELGNLLPREEAATYSEIMWDIIGSAFTHSQQNCMSISPNESLLDFFQTEISKRLQDDTPECERKRALLLQTAQNWGNFVGNHVSTQSLKYFWLEECIDGENLFCADTYKKILSAVTKPVEENANADIRYRTIVRQVECTDDEKEEQLKVQTETGETLDFDEVVFTAPLGWLKQHPEAFKPALPARLTSAIANIGYGCLEKVYINFPKPFWRSADAGSERAIGFIQFLAPKYAPDSNPESWNQEVVELASFAPESSHPTLLFYMYGAQSKYLTGKVSALPSEKAKQEFLYEWFRPYYSRLPGYNEDSPDCQPVGCFATAWLQDDLAGNGSYANFQTGLEEGDKDIEAMREGLPDRGLWLAGEHTAPFIALGTVTGAYWSGESVGKRIAQAYCRGKGGVTIGQVRSSM